MIKNKKAKKHHSPELQELLDEVTPVEMEQTKVKMMLASRLADYVQVKGWSYTKFAEITGKNPSEITKWLSGTQNFTLDVLTEIAFALKIDLMSLFGSKQTRTVYINNMIVKLTAEGTELILDSHSTMDNSIMYSQALSQNQSILIPITQFNQVA